MKASGNTLFEYPLGNHLEAKLIKELDVFAEVSYTKEHLDMIGRREQQKSTSYKLVQAYRPRYVERPTFTTCFGEKTLKLRAHLMHSFQPADGFVFRP